MPGMTQETQLMFVRARYAKAVKKIDHLNVLNRELRRKCKLTMCSYDITSANSIYCDRHFIMGWQPKAERKEVKKYCKWVESKLNGLFKTSCGWLCNSLNNDAKFCCHCGKRLKEVKA